VSTIRPANGWAFLSFTVTSARFSLAFPVACSIEGEARQANQILSASSDTFDRLEQQVAERTKELAAPDSIAAAVSQYLDLDQVLDNALDVTLEVMGDARIKVGSGVRGWVVTSGKSLLVPDVSKEPRFVSPVPVSSRSERMYTIYGPPRFAFSR
jgi:hypothetical protein